MPSTAATEDQPLIDMFAGERPTTAKFLIRPKAYPFAETPTSCFSLIGMSQGEVNYWLPAIKSAARSCPGTFIFGAGSFPRYREEAELFFTTAGFDLITTLMLIEGMPEMPVE